MNLLNCRKNGFLIHEGLISLLILSFFAIYINQVWQQNVKSEQKLKIELKQQRVQLNETRAKI